ncbi:MAG: hypothetical protein J6X44_05805 [Thermoguttaceae bacterium]|nr:hypothetical protein [Thermoguttaceae bacterium]
MKTSWCMKNVYRAKWCEKHRLRLLSKVFMSLNAFICGRYVDYHAEIPKDSSISHYGIGVVVNGNAVIGSNVFIGYGVTMGNRAPNHKGRPIIDNVYIGNGSYLGGFGSATTSKLGPVLLL